MGRHKITRKLRQAAAVLEGERYGDFEPGFLIDLVQQGFLSHEQIYTALFHFGYRWKNGHWQRSFPRWLEALIRREEEKALLNANLNIPTMIKLRHAAFASRRRS